MVSLPSLHTNYNSGYTKSQKKFGISDNIFFIKVINEKIILGEKYVKY